MCNKKNTRGFNLIDFGLNAQALTLNHKPVLFKPDLEPLIEEINLLNKAVEELNRACEEG